MNIVLNETQWAKNAIDNSDLGIDARETLRRVARYYFDNGMTAAQVQESVNSFLISCDPSVSTVKWALTTGGAVAFASKHKAVNIGKVCITESEIQKIRSISFGKQAERLAFTLLCLAKYWNACADSDSGWVNSSDSDIMKMANIKTAIKRQCKLYHDLIELGLISPSNKIDCTHLRVNFVDDNSPVVMEITDFRSLGNQYLAYIGEPFFKCAECGVCEKYEVHGAGRKKKYCSSCAAVVNSRKSVESIIRKRMKQ